MPKFKNSNATFWVIFKTLCRSSNHILCCKVIQNDKGTRKTLHVVNKRQVQQYMPNHNYYDSNTFLHICLIQRRGRDRVASRRPRYIDAALALPLHFPALSPLPRTAEDIQELPPEEKLLFPRPGRFSRDEQVERTSSMMMIGAATT